MKKINLTNYSSGSFGNIFKDSQLNVYKFTVINENGLLTMSNINELIIFNLLKIINEQINKNTKTEIDSDYPSDNSLDYSPNNTFNSESTNSVLNAINLHDLISYDVETYKTVLTNKIIIQSYTTNYYDYNSLNKTFNFTDLYTRNTYNTLLFNRSDKYLLVSQLPNYALNLSKFIEKYHSYCISNFDIFVKNLLQSLSVLHNNGLLHGDLKSANILITSAKKMCITDFGGVKIPFFDAYYLSCTITSRCPEDLNFEHNKQLIYENTNYKSDIWSLGLIFAEILLGYNPILKVYQQFKSSYIKNDLIEQDLLSYYKSIEYVNILDLVNDNIFIKNQLDKNYDKKIKVIEKMLTVDHTKRISTIKEIYEEMFDEKFDYNYTILYDYNYLKFGSQCDFSAIHSVRKIYYNDMIEVCNKLHILFICPLLIDIFDRLLLKMNHQIKKYIISPDNFKLYIILSGLIILTSGLYNQLHPSYAQILTLLNIKYESIIIASINNVLFELLELLDYDIYRPFNIFYCPFYLKKQKCNCKIKKNIKETHNIKSYTIHNSTEHNYLEKTLKFVIENNLIGLSPDDYYEKLEAYTQL